MAHISPHNSPGHVTHEGQRMIRRYRRKERRKASLLFPQVFLIWEIGAHRVLRPGTVSHTFYCRGGSCQPMVEIYASLARTVLGETSSASRCAQLTTLCHLHNWHLHVREWQQHQSVPCFEEIRQRISRAHPERFASTVSLMPVSALALMEHIMPQIMESYTAAVDPIWMWCYS